jgi:uncharacterized protein (TIGR02099 family)
VIAKGNWLRRCGKVCLYTLAGLAVLCAVAISLLRASLPYLNQYHDKVIDWLVADQAISIEVQSIDAGWYKLGPVLIVNTLDVKFDTSLPYDFDVERIKISIDFWDSLLEGQLRLNNLILDGVQIKFPLSPFVKTDVNDPAALATPELTQFLDIFFRQLSHFELTNSNLRVVNPAGQEKIIQVPELAWVNEGNRHRGEGWAYINDDMADNNLRIMIDVSSEKDDLTNVSGQIYLQAENMSLSNWFERVLFKREGLKQGTLNFESWIDIVNNRPTAALLKLKPSKFNWQHGPNQQRLNISAGYLQWQVTDAGWQLDSNDLALVTNGIAWPPLAIQIRQQDDDILFASNQIELSKLAPIVALSRYIDDTLFTDLATMYPHGLVKNIKVKVPLQDWNKLSYQLQVEDLQLQTWQGIPGFNNLDLMLSGTLGMGKASIEMDDAVLDFAHHLEQKIRVNRFATDLYWYRYGSAEYLEDNLQTAIRPSGIEIIADSVFLDTPELVLKSQFLLDLPEANNAFLSLAGDVELRDASKAFYYYPTEYMSEPLIDYLKAALQAGNADNGQLLWFGEFANYPYAAGDGIFQAQVNVLDAQFKFDPEWPSLTDLQLNLLFQNEDLFMSSRRGYLDAVVLTKLDAQLPTLGSVEALTIQAEFDATGKTAKSLIDKSPLPALADTLEAIQVQGDITGSIDLVIPFTGAPVGVAGEIALQDNQVYLNDLDLTLNEVTGNFSFDDAALVSTPIHATLLGEALDLSFTSKQNLDAYQVNIDLAGNWNSEQLVAQAFPDYASYLSGGVNWRGELNLVFPENGFNYELDIQSDLNELTLNLPRPLAKSAGEHWPTTVSVVGNDKQANVQLESGELLYFSGLINYAAADIELIQSLVQIGNTDALLLPDAANAIVVNVDDLNIADWKHWYLALPDDGITLNTASVPLSSVKIAVSETMLQQQRLNNVEVTATKGYRNWGIKLQSSEFNGEVIIPDIGDVHIDFDYLYLPDLALSGPDTTDTTVSVQAIENNDNSYDWQAIPSFNLNCSACILGDMNLGKVFASVTNDGLGLNLNALDIDMEHSTLAATGRWFSDKHGLPKTQVQGQLQTKSVEKFVDGLGQISPLANTPANLDFSLSWQDKVFNFEPASLSGYASFSGKGGRILSVSDKGTRFLSLLSVQSLVKKLSLDFSDVFNDGLPYYSMSGSVNIADGLVTNDDFILNASSGKVSGSGTIDLASEQIDYDLSFFPDVTSSLPVLAAFAVTPTTALAVFALSKILEPVVEVITEIKFEISGNLQDPTFTELFRNQKEIKVPNQLIESAEAQANEQALKTSKPGGG